jgi:hypothetical protein
MGNSYQSTGANQNSNEGYVPIGPSNQNWHSKEKLDLDIHHYPYRIHHNGSVTIFYSGEQQKTPAEQTLKTVYVRNVPLAMFYDHTFKDMMSECGAVDTISHMRKGAGSAFVLFCDEMAVQKAIDKFHGYPMGNGLSLGINVPDKSRDRGYSMSSFNSDRRNGYGDTQFRGPSGNHHNGHARTISANAPREPYRPPMPEIPENRDAQSYWQPLQDVSNMSTNHRSVLQNAAGRACFEPSTAASSPKKENSPMTTPSQSGMQTPRKPKSKTTLHNGRKTSQQNSTQPTPLGSPKRPILDRKSTSDNSKGGETKKQDTLQRSDQVLLHEHVAQRLAPIPSLDLNQDTAQDVRSCNMLAQQLRSVPESAERVVEDASKGPILTEVALPAETAPKSKAKNKSKKKGSANNAKNMSSSFTTDASSEIISPVDNNGSIFEGNASTNTSFSISSSRQPSVNPTSRKTREVSQKTNDNSGVTSHSNEPSEKKKTAREASGSLPKAKTTKGKPSKNQNATGDSVSNLASGHQKNLSTSSMMSTSSQRKADVMIRNADQQISTSAASLAPTEGDVNKVPEPVMTPSPATKVKKNFVDRRPISIVIPSPTVGVENMPESVSSSVVSPSTMVRSPQSVSDHLMSPRSLPEVEKSPKQLSEQDWPALASSKSPVIAIADGKPPTPIRAPLAKLLIVAEDDKSPEVKKSPEIRKTPKSAIFPPVAVPRYFESSRSSA